MLESFQLNSRVNVPMGGTFESAFVRAARALSGHMWTVTPALQDACRRPLTTLGRPFQVSLEDPSMGNVRLTGTLDEPNDATSLLMIVHGYGSNANSSQCIAMAPYAMTRGEDGKAVPRQMSFDWSPVDSDFTVDCPTGAIQLERTR